MYQALYRKYRPQTFDDVVGQEHIVGTIRKQVASGRISHAYMFTGTRGTGKTTCAKILARAVNCEHPVNGDPCNECPTCRGLADGSILDVFEIDAASNNGVDNIRELREDVMFTPASTRYKVYIIDEVHMLSTSAFNALLKTLEEPPEHIIFIFATTDINKVPQTIISRCQRFDFKRISAEQIKARVLKVAESEGIALEDEAAALISRLADGALRDALSILDRCISGGTDVTLASVERTVGVCPYDQMCDVLSAVAKDDTAAVLEFYNECRATSRDSVAVFSELCTYLRDMMLLKITNGASGLTYGGGKLERIRSVAGEFTLEKLSRSIEILQNGINDVSRFKDKHIIAELALIKLTTPAIGGDISDIEARLSRLEAGGVKAPAPEKPKPAVKPKPITEPAPDPVPEPSEPAGQAKEGDVMPDILEILHTTGNPSVTPFLEGRQARCKGDALYITCGADEFEYDILNTPANKSALAEAASRLTGRPMQVHFEQAPAQPKQEADDVLNELLSEASDILYEE